MAANPDLVELDIMLIDDSKKNGKKTAASQLIHCIDPEGSSTKSKEYKLNYFNKVRSMRWQDGDIPLCPTFVVVTYLPETCKARYFLRNMFVFPFALNDRTTFESVTETCSRTRRDMKYMSTLIVGLQTESDSEGDLTSEAQQFVEELNINDDGGINTRYISLNPQSQSSVEALKNVLIEIARTTKPYIEYQKARAESAKSEIKCSIM